MGKRQRITCLTVERREEVREAFVHWYEGLKHKLEGMSALGITNKSVRGCVSAFKSGRRTPTPSALAVLWKLTADKRFLFTAQEKNLKLAQGKVQELPSQEEWPDKETLPTNHDSVPLSELLNTHGGETSPLGVRMVLGKASFVEIDLNPPEDLIILVGQQIQMVRGLLNLLVQIRDEKTRGLVRKRIGPQVEELELSIRLFCDVHPNNLTKLHDAQRHAWAGNGSSKKKF